MRKRPPAAASKNCRGRVLRLVDAFVEDLRPLMGEPDEHVFRTPRAKSVADSYQRVLHRFRELLAEAAIGDEESIFTASGTIPRA